MTAIDVLTDETSVRRRAHVPPLPRGAGAQRVLRLAGHLAGPLAAVLVWALSLRRIDPNAIAATGLVSVMPAPVLAALGALVVSFCWSLRQRADGWVLGAHVVALVVMLYALAAIVEPEPAFEPAYRHVGIADHIAATGSLDTTIDAYFNWPGFFAGLAILTRIAGLPDALGLVRWAPLAYNLLYLAPLLVIMRALTADRRVVWLAVWIFYVTNWPAQDYLSPQATAYLLLLVVLAVLLRWFTPPVAAAPPSQRAALIGVVVLASAAIVAMHQLTPFALLFAVVALVVFADCTARLLPVIVLALIAAWTAFMTVGFMSGNLHSLLAGIGDLGGTLSSNLSARVGGGDPGHRLVVEARIDLTVAVWALAAAGWVTLRRRRTPVRAATALALAPFPMLVLQPYGGEILIRVALFALPFVACLAASALVAASDAPAPMPSLAAGATVVLLAAFMLARYGNDRMDAFSPGDVAAVRALYRIAPRDSELIAASQPLPWQYRDYIGYTYERLTDLLPGPPPPPGTPHEPLTYRIRAALRSTVPGRAYVIVTRSQIAGDALLGTPGTPARTVEQRLDVSQLFRLVFHDRDARIYALRRASRAAG